MPLTLPDRPPRSQPSHVLPRLRLGGAAVLAAILLAAALLTGCDGGPGTAPPDDSTDVTLESVEVDLNAPPSRQTHKPVTVSAEATARLSNESEAPVDSLTLRHNDSTLVRAADTTAISAQIDSSATAVGTDTIRARAWATRGDTTLTDEATRTIEIEERPNRAPTLTTFSVPPDSGRSPVAAHITAGATDPDGPAPTIRIDINDDGTDEITHADDRVATTREYAAEGTHALLATAVDAEGAESDVKRDTVHVNPELHALELILTNMTRHDRARAPATFTVNDTTLQTTDGTARVNVEEGRVLLGRPESDAHIDDITAFTRQQNARDTTIAYTDPHKQRDTIEVEQDRTIYAQQINENVIVDCQSSLLKCKRDLKIPGHVALSENEEPLRRESTSSERSFAWQSEIALLKMTCQSFGF